ncbi:MAG: 4-hydroxy-tetrahydrodipicolinate reductase [Gemmatimonadetes bacterium]|nr:4-hydroxy-tetrahydrodipicolinate reductase [Gemmatimonadota bacterium]
MGQALVRLAQERRDIEIIGGISSGAGHGVNEAGVPDDASAGSRPTSGATGSDTSIRIVTPDAAADLITAADVVIDFSVAEATRALLGHAGDAIAGRALIVGTTGLDPAVQEQLDSMAERAAVLTAANFSVGVNLLLGLTRRVAAALEPASHDIEIVEAHHRRKVDAPSGTALALGGAAAEGRHVALANVRRDGRSGDSGPRPEGEIGFHAVRGGGIVGDHRVIFAGERERIELVHEALDRAVFAEGALAAARWIDGRERGRWTMQDVLGM